MDAGSAPQPLSRKGRLARGATAGKVEVDEAEAAKAFERSLAPLV